MTNRQSKKFPRKRRKNWTLGVRRRRAWDDFRATISARGQNRSSGMWCARHSHKKLSAPEEFKISSRRNLQDCERPNAGWCWLPETTGSESPPTAANDRSHQRQSRRPPDHYRRPIEFLHRDKKSFHQSARSRSGHRQSFSTGWRAALRFSRTTNVNSGRRRNARILETISTALLCRGRRPPGFFHFDNSRTPRKTIQRIIASSRSPSRSKNSGVGS